MPQLTIRNRPIHPHTISPSLVADDHEIRVPQIDSQSDEADVRCSAEITSLNSAPVYQSLDSDNREIRVLRIEPSQPDEVVIRCSLETVSLNSTVAYQALSYEWGLADVGEPPSRVLLNSHEVPTTPNLRLALKHLPSGPAYWIDALCIDQSEDNERGHQVRLMTEIYRQASAVIVWLGLEEGSSTKGMEFLNDIGAYLDETKNAITLEAKFHDWFYETLSNNAYNTHWDGLRQIFQRSYWSRLWVIQELVVTPRPDEVWLLCGSSKARFTHLRVVSRMITAFASQVPTLYSAYTLDGTIVQLKELAERVRDVTVLADQWGSPNPKKRHLGLVRLISRYRALLCADPRDKVYALLGVSALHQGLELPITYAIPVLDVYRNLAQYDIAGSQRLDILTYAGHDQYETPVRPSWVPNWQHDRRTRRMVRIAWYASGTLPSVTRFSADHNTLVTQAFVLGTITSLHETGDFYLEESNFDSMAILFAAGRIELAQWLGFIESPQWHDFLNGPSQTIAYELLLYVVDTPKIAEENLPFREFRRLCRRLSLSEQEFLQTKDNLRYKNISHLLNAMKHQRHLCAIKLKSAMNDHANQDAPSCAAEEERFTMGFCSRNARVDDVVAVVRGCMHPLLLRKVDEGRLEVIGELYVYGFMKGQALKMFEEVEIELV